jgi:hypothetical protein
LLGILETLRALGVLAILEMLGVLQILERGSDVKR